MYWLLPEKKNPCHLSLSYRCQEKVPVECIKRFTKQDNPAFIKVHHYSI